MRILAIVPAFNEEKNIATVIRSIKLFNSDIDVVVVNDGSQDNTGAAAAATGLAQVVNLPCNLGIGGGVQTGFKFAKKYDYDLAFQVDGDGQHIASEATKLFQPILEGRADVVIGSRFKERTDGFQSTRLRRFGIRIFQIVNSLLIGQSITDNTSGFRAYGKPAIRFLAENYPVDYPEPEAVVLLGRNGFRIEEVAVLMLERQGGVSSISGFKSAYYMIKVLLSIFVTSIRSRVT